MSDNKIHITTNNGYFFASFPTEIPSFKNTNSNSLSLQIFDQYYEVDGPIVNTGGTVYADVLLFGTKATVQSSIVYEDPNILPFLFPQSARINETNGTNMLTLQPHSVYKTYALIPPVSSDGCSDLLTTNCLTFDVIFSDRTINHFVCTVIPHIFGPLTSTPSDLIVYPLGYTLKISFPGGIPPFQYFVADGLYWFTSNRRSVSLHDPNFIFSTQTPIKVFDADGLMIQIAFIPYTVKLSTLKPKGNFANTTFHLPNQTITVPLLTTTDDSGLIINHYGDGYPFKGLPSDFNSAAFLTVNTLSDTGAIDNTSNTPTKVVRALSSYLSDITVPMAPKSSDLITATSDLFTFITNNAALTGRMAAFNRKVFSSNGILKQYEIIRKYILNSKISLINKSNLLFVVSQTKSACKIQTFTTILKFHQFFQQGISTGIESTNTKFNNLVNKMSLCYDFVCSLEDRIQTEQSSLESIASTIKLVIGSEYSIISCTKDVLDSFADRINYFAKEMDDAAYTTLYSYRMSLSEDILSLIYIMTDNQDIKPYLLSFNHQYYSAAAHFEHADVTWDFYNALKNAAKKAKNTLSNLNSDIASLSSSLYSSIQCLMNNLSETIESAIPAFQSDFARCRSDFSYQMSLWAPTAREYALRGLGQKIKRISSFYSMIGSQSFSVGGGSDKTSSIQFLLPSDVQAQTIYCSDFVAFAVNSSYLTGSYAFNYWIPSDKIEICRIDTRASDDLFVYQTNQTCAPILLLYLLFLWNKKSNGEYYEKSKGDEKVSQTYSQLTSSNKPSTEKLTELISNQSGIFNEWAHEAIAGTRTSFSFLALKGHFVTEVSGNFCQRENQTYSIGYMFCHPGYEMYIYGNISMSYYIVVKPINMTCLPYVNSQNFQNGKRTMVHKISEVLLYDKGNKDAYFNGSLGYVGYQACSSDFIELTNCTTYLPQNPTVQVPFGTLRIPVKRLIIGTARVLSNFVVSNLYCPLGVNVQMTNLSSKTYIKINCNYGNTTHTVVASDFSISDKQIVTYIPTPKNYGTYPITITLIDPTNEYAISNDVQNIAFNELLISNLNYPTQVLAGVNQPFTIKLNADKTVTPVLTINSLKMLGTQKNNQITFDLTSPNRSEVYPFTIKLADPIYSDVYQTISGSMTAQMIFYNFSTNIPSVLSLGAPTISIGTSYTESNFAKKTISDLAYASKNRSDIDLTSAFNISSTITLSPYDYSDYTTNVYSVFTLNSDGKYYSSDYISDAYTVKIQNPDMLNISPVVFSIPNLPSASDLVFSLEDWNWSMPNWMVSVSFYTIFSKTPFLECNKLLSVKRPDVSFAGNYIFINDPTLMLQGESLASSQPIEVILDFSDHLFETTKHTLSYKSLPLELQLDAGINPQDLVRMKTIEADLYINVL